MERRIQLGHIPEAMHSAIPEHCEKRARGAAIKVLDSASEAGDNDEKKKVGYTACAGNKMERQKVKRTGEGCKILYHGVEIKGTE